MKAEVIRTEPGVGSVSGKDHLCLHSRGVAGSHHSSLHAWLKYPLFRELNLAWELFWVMSVQWHQELQIRDPLSCSDANRAGWRSSQLCSPGGGAGPAPHSPGCSAGLGHFHHQAGAQGRLYLTQPPHPANCTLFS